MAPQDEQQLSKLRLNLKATVLYNKQAETRNNATHYLFDLSSCAECWLRHPSACPQTKNITAQIPDLAWVTMAISTFLNTV